MYGNRKGPGRTSPQCPSDAQAREKLAIFVYEYLLHQNAKQAAETFLKEINWKPSVAISISEQSPGFLHQWWCVFWDLYCAAPERRNNYEHSQEAKAFHDYGLVQGFPMTNGIHPQNASASPMTSGGHPMASTPGAGEQMMMGGAGPGGMPPGFARQASRGSPGMPGQQQRYNGPPRPMPPNTRPDQMFQPGPGGMPPGMFDPMRAGPMGGPRGPGMPPGPPRGMAPNGGGPPPNVNSYAMRPGAPGPPGMMQGYRYGPPQMVNGPGTPIMPSPHDEQRTFMMAAGPGPSAGPQPNQPPPNSAYGAPDMAVPSAASVHGELNGDGRSPVGPASVHDIKHSPPNAANGGTPVGGVGTPTGSAPGPPSASAGGTATTNASAAGVANGAVQAKLESQSSESMDYSNAFGAGEVIYEQSEIAKIKASMMEESKAFESGKDDDYFASI